MTELKRRSRRISSSISFCARRRSSNFSALALFQRENRSSVGGRWFGGFRFGYGVGSGGAKIGNGIGNFSAIISFL